MAFPKPLRLQLGLSLAEFADLLNTNVGQLSMAESGLRDLPAASLEIANALEKTLSLNKMQIVNDNKLSKKAIALLNKEIRGGQVKLEALKTEEEKLAEKLSAAKRLIVVSKVSIKLPTAANSEDLALHMALLQRKAAKKIEQLEIKRIRLQLLIGSIEAINVRAKALLNN